MFVQRRWWWPCTKTSYGCLVFNENASPSQQMKFVDPVAIVCDAGSSSKQHLGYLLWFTRWKYNKGSVCLSVCLSATITYATFCSSSMLCQIGVDVPLGWFLYGVISLLILRPFCYIYLAKTTRVEWKTKLSEMCNRLIQYDKFDYWFQSCEYF